MQEQQQAHALEQQKSDAERKGAIAALAALDAEPQALAQHAVDLIKRFTSAGGVYAASVAEPEEPDWTPPEDTEEGAAESGDEEDPLPSAPEAAVPEGGETAAGEGGAEAAPSSEVDVAAAPKIQRPINYSKKYFSYMAASADQTFMHKAELFRPPPPPEDAGDDFQPEPIAPTFRILDEKIPMIYSANISFETGARFFRNFPKIGSYQACGVQVPAGNVGGEFKAVIAADTLFPEGNGQPLSQADQDFIWEVSLALSKAFEARESKVGLGLNIMVQINVMKPETLTFSSLRPKRPWPPRVQPMPLKLSRRRLSRFITLRLQKQPGELKARRTLLLFL
jgi:hypothetical protein